MVSLQLPVLLLALYNLSMYIRSTNCKWFPCFLESGAAQVSLSHPQLTSSKSIPFPSKHCLIFLLVNSLSPGCCSLLVHTAPHSMFYEANKVLEIKIHGLICLPLPTPKLCVADAHGNAPVKATAWSHPALIPNHGNTLSHFEFRSSAHLFLKNWLRVQPK